MAIQSNRHNTSVVLGRRLISAFSLLTGFLAGGITGRQLAPRTPFLYGGKLISLSTRGDVIFFMIGGLAGTVAVVCALSLAWDRIPKSTFISLTLFIVIGILGAMIIGPIGAFAGLFGLYWFFFSGPKDIIQLLFE